VKAKIQSAVNDLYGLRDDVIEFHDALARINQKFGHQAVPYLLTLPELPEDAIEAHYLLIHTVESLACPDYILVLFEQAGSMFDICPQRLRVLLGRSIVSERHFRELLQQLPVVEAATRKNGFGGGWATSA
jgi:hypothetical protein